MLDFVKGALLEIQERTRECRYVFYKQLLGVGIWAGAERTIKQSRSCHTGESLAGREFEIPGEAVVRK